jgi:UDP-N-acetylmuramoyl-tripeptide--D-alanyl-D-alanine ligase
MIVYLITLFWFLRQTKSVLFWLYLWQLKEYHIGRFIDHFRTWQGRKILFNKILVLKLIVFCGFLVLGLAGEPDGVLVAFSTFLLLLYTAESAKMFLDLFGRRFKKPIFTFKMIFLFLASLLLELFYLLSSYYSEGFVMQLLLFDIVTPLVVSGIVLLFQPAAYLLRDRIIRRAAARMKDFPGLLVIGITGSYGKTSTKELLAAILSQRFKVAKTREHRNSEIGVALSVLNDLKPEHEVFVVEMGAYNKGGIRLLCDIVKPKMGILTGINQQHLATFGSLDNIISAKYELIGSLPKDGTAFFNGNNKHCRKLYEKTEIAKKIVFFPSRNEDDIFVEDVRERKETVSFRASDAKGDSADFTIKTIGVHNLENLMLAISCAHYLGMGIQEIASAVSKINSFQTGMKVVSGIGRFDVIDSTYSANPSGVMAHLEHLKLWRGKKVVVMPCLIELGEASEDVHREIGKKIGEVCDLAFIVNRGCVGEMAEGASESGGGEGKVFFSDSPREIAGKIRELGGEAGIMLLEGRLPKKIIASVTVKNHNGK